MKPETTTKKFTSLDDHFNPSQVTDIDSYSTPEIRLTDRFEIWYNNPVHGEGRPTQVIGQQLLEEMERVAGSRRKEHVITRISIKVL